MNFFLKQKLFVDSMSAFDCIILHQAADGKSANLQASALAPIEGFVHLQRGTNHICLYFQSVDQDALILGCKTVIFFFSRIIEGCSFPILVMSPFETKFLICGLT